MRGIAKAALVLLLPFSAAAAEPATDVGAAIDKLATSLDRLAGLLEKDVASRADEKESKRVELAVGIIGVRYRKIERLEEEIQGNTREEEDIAQQTELMKARVEQFTKQERSENGELSPELKSNLALMEIQSKASEDRAAKLRERNSALQAEVAAEKRKVASVEALIDDWMQKQ